MLTSTWNKKDDVKSEVVIGPQEFKTLPPHEAVANTNPLCMQNMGVVSLTKDEIWCSHKQQVLILYYVR